MLWCTLHQSTEHYAAKRFSGANTLSDHSKIVCAVQRAWHGVIWQSFTGAYHSLKYTEMKMRFT